MLLKNVVADKEEKVARELLACGSYKYLKTSVKANAFKFDFSDTCEIVGIKAKARLL